MLKILLSSLSISFIISSILSSSQCVDKHNLLNEIIHLRNETEKNYCSQDHNDRESHLNDAYCYGKLIAYKQMMTIIEKSSRNHTDRNP